jgi:methionyl-tRNA formyltransferase
MTQPDRPAGRGMRAAPSAVKAAALRHGLELLQPATLREPSLLARMREVGADLIVVAAYGLLLPKSLLEATPHGALNIHASLLPRWRGAAPIQRALLAGDTQSGISIMRMDTGLDTGPVFTQRAVTIGPHEDFGTLHDALAALGADALTEVLDALATGRARATPQPAQGVTYAPKVEKGETHLDWHRPAAEIERAVRAFRPTPGALARLGDELIKVWRASVMDESGSPGTVLQARGTLVIACGTQALEVEELQPAGGRRMPTADFLRGRAIPAGARFA